MATSAHRRALEAPSNWHASLPKGPLKVCLATTGSAQPQAGQDSVGVLGITTLLPVVLVGPIDQVVLPIEDAVVPLPEFHHRVHVDQVLHDQEPVLAVLLDLRVGELLNHCRPPGTVAARELYPPNC